MEGVLNNTNRLSMNWLGTVSPTDGTITGNMSSINLSFRLNRELPEFVVGMSLVRYVLPIMILAGTFGNVLSFVVLMRWRRQDASVYFYLAMLSIADTVVLYSSAFKSWLRLISGFEMLHVSSFACKFIMFVFLVGLHMSAWLIVAMTTDRFIAVAFPFRSATMCTRRRAKIITLSLLTVAVIYLSHLFWNIHLTFDEVTHRWRCAAVVGDPFMDRVFPIMKLASYSIVPFVVVLVLNVGIIHKMMRQKPTIRATTNNETVTTGRKARASMMLLAVSFTWLFLSMPFTVWTLIENKDTRDPYRGVKSFLLKSVCFILMYMNHGINFYLYCITGRKFRCQLRLIFKELCTVNTLKRLRRSWELVTNRPTREPEESCEL